MAATTIEVLSENVSDMGHWVFCRLTPADAAGGGYPAGGFPVDHAAIGFETSIAVLIPMPTGLILPIWNPADAKVMMAKSVGANVVVDADATTDYSATPIYFWAIGA